MVFFSQYFISSEYSVDQTLFSQYFVTLSLVIQYEKYGNASFDCVATVAVAANVNCPLLLLLI